MKSMGGMVLVAAGLIFAISAVVFGATVVDAVRVSDPPDPALDGVRETGVVRDDLPAGPADVDASSPETAPAEAAAPMPSARAAFLSNPYPRVTNDEILGAVNQDLFRPDRTPAVTRYLFPSERVSERSGDRNDRRRREPDVRIVGTAISGDLGLALVQVDDSIPFAVLLGEEVDGYVLAAVTEESVTLAGDGAEFTFPVVEQQRDRRSDNRSRNSRDSRNDAAVEDAARALQNRVQQMLQGMGRGQVLRPGQVPGEVQLQFVPGSGGVMRGGQLPGTGGTVILRPRGGGGGGNLP